MRIKKTYFYLILFIGFPIWFIGWGVFIWDYLLDKISNDTAKGILGFVLTVFVWFYSLKKWGDKKVEFK
jgi:hypothetical protein